MTIGDNLWSCDHSLSPIVIEGAGPFAEIAALPGFEDVVAPNARLELTAVLGTAYEVSKR